jgi:hypothetical protein
MTPCAQRNVLSSVVVWCAGSDPLGLLVPPALADGWIWAVFPVIRLRAERGIDVCRDMYGGRRYITSMCIYKGRANQKATWAFFRVL